MKKILVMILVAILLSNTFVFAGEKLGSLGDKSPVMIKLNGEYVGDSNTAPFIVKGTTMVPVRWVAENLGKDIDWDADSYTVFVDTPKSTQRIINNLLKQEVKEGGFQVLNIVVGGEGLTDFVVKPILVDGTSYVPLRALAEAIGLEIGWDNENKEVLVSSIQREESELPNIETHSEICPIVYVELGAGTILETKRVLFEEKDYLKEMGESSKYLASFTVEGYIGKFARAGDHGVYKLFEINNANGLHFSNDEDWALFNSILEERSKGIHPIYNNRDEVIGKRYFLGYIEGNPLDIYAYTDVDGDRVVDLEWYVIYGDENNIILPVIDPIVGLN